MSYYILDSNTEHVLQHLVLQIRDTGSYEPLVYNAVTMTALTSI